MSGIVAFFVWLAGTKAGRIVIAGAGLAFAVGIAVVEAFNAGKKTERTKEDEATLKNLRVRSGIDADVENVGHADLDKRMGRWVRDDDK